MMTLTSPAFTEGNPIPGKYTCDGDSLSPELFISEVPADAQSLALIVDDPDAPNGDFVHWLVWNIPAETRDIGMESMPVGSVEGTNGAGELGWIAPCPPSGTHHYHFKLYALDATLDLAGGAGKQALLAALEGHVLESAELVGTYSRA